MSSNATLDIAALNRIGAAVAAEPSLLAALVQDPAGVAHTRFGIAVPPDFTMKVGEHRIDIVAAGNRYAFDLPPSLRDAALSDELPDELLEAVAGGGGGNACHWKG